MNPLSALRTMVYPGVGNALPVQPDAQPAKIPAQELTQLPSALAPTEAKPAQGFSGLLSDMVSEVNQKQALAGDAVNGLLSGQNVSLHQAMIAMEEASVSFQLMVEVRNKLLESYQELMRMQI
jgi:flagellar hook-basal body complex protein FliE